MSTELKVLLKSFMQCKNYKARSADRVDLCHELPTLHFLTIFLVCFQVAGHLQYLQQLYNDVTAIDNNSKHL